MTAFWFWVFVAIAFAIAEIMTVALFALFITKILRKCQTAQGYT